MKNLPKYFILLSILFVPARSIGQSTPEEIDQLVTLLSYEKEKYCDQVNALDLSEYDDDILQSKIQFLQTICLPDSSVLDRIASLEETISKTSDRRVQGFLLLAKGNAAGRFDEYDAAIQYYISALGFLVEDQDRYLQAYLNLGIGYGYYTLHAHDVAIEYFEIVQDIGKDLGNLIMQVDAIDGLSNTYSNMGNSEIADSLWEIHSNLAQASGNLNVMYFDHNNRGFSFQHKEQFDSASVYFERGLNTASILEDSILIVESLLYLGENASWAGQHDRAIEIFKILEKLPAKYYNPAGATRIYSAWAEAEAGNGNYNQAYIYYKKYKEVDDEFWTTNRNNKTLELEAKYQSARKDAEINAQQLQISKSNAQRNLLVAGALGLGLLTWFLFYRNRKNQVLATSKIQNLEKQQQLLALDYMVRGQEEERKRIAQDLHDGLGGLLTSVRHQILGIQDQINSLSKIDLAGDAEKLISRACDEVRRISHDLMPASLVSLGLADAVEDLANDIREDHGLKVTVHANSDLNHLSDKVKVNIYRIIQEVANNAVKHAQADRLTISLTQENNGLKILIADNGIGFDYEKANQRGGFGLQSITSRVKYLGGELSVKSDEAGTSFAIVL